MANQYKSKIIYDGQTLIDLTADTITPADLAENVTAHDKSGAPIVGTNTKDADTSNDNAVAAEILATKTAHARGTQLTGTMPNNGAVAGTISTVSGEYTVPIGYHDGSGKVAIASAEQSKIVSANIRQGVTILGVQGTMSGSEDVNAQSRTVTPSAASQVITPETGYNYLAQVTVNAIPYVEADNAAGGVTVTIG
ncbi:MAG: hypothetical protein LIR50_10615 [Bacillota bacterium]|nr:hypothetical protein [Bacillota bacterium]